ncbi:putative acylesterase/phospholipase RssA [Spirosoma lacussanchae]|uniref:patatin-like phospholipase family protein n=1 Tax=Spirosoma lacussanchae TaxID=1884249 RepID=UPI001107BF9B|nr:patatin-like phospholipase family protein [Spirosoma lacussanchae]
MKLLLLSALCLPLLSTVMAQTDPPPKRLLVVSGGGARGAWGVGIANFLDSTGKRYAHVVGTSTGSLMAPLILLRKYDVLNRAYTSVTQKDIFTVNPFNKRGGIRLLNALCRFNKPSLGTTENLRNLIRTFVTPADYAQIRTSPLGLDFTVSVVNLRTLEAAYKSASQHPDYEEMVNWTWASANQPVFMSPYITRNEAGADDFWADGGVRNPIPIREGLQLAFDKRYEAVDVIINSLPSADEPASSWPDGKATVFKALTRTLATYGSGTREMNIAIGRLLNRLNQLTRPQPAEQASLSSQPVGAEAAEPSLVLTFYFMPHDLYALIPNELIFDPATMTTLLEAGRRGRYVTQVQEAIATPGLPVEGTYSFQLSRTTLGRLLKELNP